MNRFILFSALIISTLISKTVIGQINLDSCQVIYKGAAGEVLTDRILMGDKGIALIFDKEVEEPSIKYRVVKLYDKNFALIDSSQHEVSVKKWNPTSHGVNRNSNFYGRIKITLKGEYQIEYLDYKTGEFKIIENTLEKDYGIKEIYFWNHHAYAIVHRRRRSYTLIINLETNKPKLEEIPVKENNYLMYAEAFQSSNDKGTCAFLTTHNRNQYYALHIDNKNQQTYIPLHEFTDYQIDDAFYSKVEDNEYVYIGKYGNKMTDYGIFFMHVKDGSLLKSNFIPYFDLKDITDLMTYDPDKSKELRQKFNRKENEDLGSYSLDLKQFIRTNQGYVLSADLIRNNFHQIYNAKIMYGFSLLSFDSEGNLIWSNHIPIHHEYYINNSSTPNAITQQENNYLEVVHLQENTLQKGQISKEGRYEPMDNTSDLTSSFKNREDETIIVNTLLPWYSDVFIGQLSLKTPKQVERGYHEFDINIKLKPH